MKYVIQRWNYFVSVLEEVVAYSCTDDNAFATPSTIAALRIAIFQIWFFVFFPLILWKGLGIRIRF